MSISDKATNCQNVCRVRTSEVLGVRRQVGKPSCYLKTCCIFYVLFKNKETLGTNIAIVIPFPAMDVVALASKFDGQWDFKSQKRADM